MSSQSFPRKHEPVDAFWRVWQENGETGKHGVYESTWMALDAALNALSENALTDEDIERSWINAVRQHFDLKPTD